MKMILTLRPYVLNIKEIATLSFGKSLTYLGQSFGCRKVFKPNPLRVRLLTMWAKSLTLNKIVGVFKKIVIYKKNKK